MVQLLRERLQCAVGLIAADIRSHDAAEILIRLQNDIGQVHLVRAPVEISGSGANGSETVSQPRPYFPGSGVPGFASGRGGMLTTGVSSFRSVSGLTSAGPRFPSPAFHPAHFAK